MCTIHTDPPRRFLGLMCLNDFIIGVIRIISDRCIRLYHVWICYSVFIFVLVCVSVCFGGGGEGGLYV